MINIIIILALSYLAGSIPTAYLAGKIVKNIDLREHGSGNLGATNTIRVLGLLPGIIVLLIDSAKGFLAVSFLPGINLGWAVWSVDYDILRCFIALTVIAGHIWPVWLSFKGGRGVATGAGAFLKLVPFPVLSALLIFLTAFSVGRYVSIGSIFAAVSFPVFLIIFKEDVIYQIFGTLISAVVIIKHIPNIKRLLKGEEHKI